MSSKSKPIRQSEFLTGLPASNLAVELPSTMDFYGASRVLATYCRHGIENIVPKLSWQHGWKPSAQKHVDPLLLIMEPAVDRDKLFLVARKDEAEYLRSHDINARAIGLPFVYAVPAAEVVRRSQSLLVMPAHSLDYTSHQWKFEEYANQIAAIRDQFDTVVVCVHPSCVEKRYWLPEFERLGFDCISGADVYDTNGLVRVRTIMDQFEFMTTNTLGSHVAYAAASGVKVSVFGDYTEFRAEDFAHSEYYQRNPHLLAIQLEVLSRSYVESHFPDLFCEPSQATEKTEWGKSEIGWDRRLSPAEIRQLLGWDRRTHFKRKFKKVCRDLTRAPERLIKSVLR